MDGELELTAHFRDDEARDGLRWIEKTLIFLSDSVTLKEAKELDRSIG